MLDISAYGYKKGIYADDISFVFTESLPTEDMAAFQREFMHYAEPMKWADDVKLAQVGRAFEVINKKDVAQDRLFQLWQTIEVDGKTLYAFVCHEKKPIHSQPTGRDRAPKERKKSSAGDKLGALLRGPLVPSS